MRGEASVSKRKRLEPKFVPEVIEEGSDGELGFLAFIPSEIEARDNNDPRHTGIRAQHLVRSSHERSADRPGIARRSVLRENSRRKEMDYFTKPKIGLLIRVIFEKSTGGWHRQKFKGRWLIRSAFGSTFNPALIHTTMGGPESGER
jgi:hypothetical protein